jgi:Flp pilus assembly protein TadB
MSAQRTTPSRPTAVSDIAYRRPDMTELRARRREARRRTRLARVDLGLGFLGALILLLATPGLAISSLIAGIVLAACIISMVVERRRRARAQSGEPRRSRTRRRSSSTPDRRSRHSAETAVVERPRSPR